MIVPNKYQTNKTLAIAITAVMVFHTMTLWAINAYNNFETLKTNEMHDDITNGTIELTINYENIIQKTTKLKVI